MVQNNYFLDLVRKRYSCRSYINKSIQREKIERCLEAARLAPSACNSQPWRFIVVEAGSLKDKLCKKAFSGIYSMNGFVAGAPVLVVVIREASKCVTRLGGLVRGLDFALVDIGIASEHFVLQATEEGLATSWIGCFDSDAVKSILGLPKKVRVDILISLGYPALQTNGVKDRKDIKEIAEFRV